MNKYIIICSIAFASFLGAQNKLSLNLGYGYYLSNSENSLRIMENQKYKSIFFFGLAYQKEDLFGLNLAFEYSYQQNTKENIIEFIQTGANSPEPIDKFGSDISLITHNFDFDWVNNINENFSFGIGPSFIIVNRIYETDEIEFDGAARSLYDKLASSGLGINGFFYFMIPLDSNEQYFFLNSKLKFRYTHSIWFDEGIRDLDNYKQEFFTGNISVGIGYSF